MKLKAGTQATFAATCQGLAERIKRRFTYTTW